MKCLIFFRLTIASVDKDGKVTERKSSEIQKISLQKDEVTPIQHISVSMLHHLRIYNHRTEADE